MTADANKAESLHCMDRARECLKTGEYERAKRMLDKAKSLDPNQDISYLKAKVDSAMESKSSRDSEDRSYAHDDHYEEPSLRSRKPQRANVQKTVPATASSTQEKAKSRSSSRTPKLGVDYTKEQMELVSRIRSCKDYYEILRVSKTATDVEIKKEYRKMALQLHPDKCRAPHSTEAFKALGNAYAILSDSDKRKQYDLYGADSVQNAPSPSRRRGGGGEFFQYDYGHGFEADFTPEEIFNMFFGGGYPSDHVRHRQRYAGRTRDDNHNQNDNPYGPLLQLLPLIAILVLGLFAQVMVGDPPFSLSQSNKYPLKRVTAELNVPYYVRHDFAQSYAGRIKQVENQVEEDYLQHLRMNCYKEQNQRDSLIYRARWQRDNDLLKKAQDMVMPNCDQLKVILSR